MGLVEGSVAGATTTTNRKLIRHGVESEPGGSRTKNQFEHLRISAPVITRLQRDYKEDQQAAVAP